MNTGVRKRIVDIIKSSAITKELDLSDISYESDLYTDLGLGRLDVGTIIMGVGCEYFHDIPHEVADNIKKVSRIVDYVEKTGVWKNALQPVKL